MVMGIWRYPVKSAQGESLASVFVGLDGPDGDRSWAAVASDGIIVSAKNPRRWGRLLHVVASLQACGRVVVLDVPGHEPVVAGTAEANGALSSFLGEPVRLINIVPPDASLQRTWPTEDGMIADWVATARPGEDAITPVTGARPGGRFVDFGAVHVVTTDELAQLEREGVEVDVRRFRPNLVLTLERPLSVGDVVHVGSEVTLGVSTPTPRCALPGAEQLGLPRAPELLQALGRHRIEIPNRSRAASFGTYLEVLTPGTVRVGDRAMIAV